MYYNFQMSYYLFLLYIPSNPLLNLKWIMRREFFGQSLERRRDGEKEIKSIGSFWTFPFSSYNKCKHGNLLHRVVMFFNRGIDLS